MRRYTPTDDAPDPESPPEWWLRHAPPPVGLLQEEHDDFDADAFDLEDGSAPRYFVTTEVEVIGRSLAPLIWIGRQWCVSTRGIERRDGTFAIDRRYVWHARHGVKAMAAKMEGIDLEDYAEALRIGRRVHREGIE